MTTSFEHSRQPVGPDRLRSLLTPRSIAIVGASEKSAWSRYTVGNLRSGGFSGRLYLVNRSGAVTHGSQTYPSLLDVPNPPDLAYLLTSSGSVLDVLSDAAKVGVPNLVVLAAGYAEAGQAGMSMQEDLVAAARANGQLVLGPNNLGFINSHAGLAAFSFETPLPLLAGGVGIVSQSGALAIYLVPYMNSRDIGTSHVITLGNEAMIGAVDAMEFLLEDSHTTVIGLYVEQIRDPAGFVAVARRAREVGKPVVMYKVGRGESGARVAAAHTGALVGDDRVIDAICRQHGVIRVESVEDLVTTAGLLESYGELPGERVGVVLGSGAMCALVGERADAVSLSLPQPSVETATALAADGLPDFATVQNPLDVTGYVTVDPTIMAKAERRMIEDPNVDILVINTVLPRSESEGLTASLRAQVTVDLSAESSKPVIHMGFLPSETTPFVRQWRRAAGLPLLVESFDRGIPALAKAIWWAKRRRALDGLPAVDGLVAVAKPEGADGWSEAEAGAFLRELGLPYLPATLVTSPDRAADAAAMSGFPVVLKVASADIAHKTEVGGVRLGLDSAHAVRAAFTEIQDTVRAARPEARIAGVTVSPMRTGGLELLVGIVRDADWGLVLAVGFGGVLVEIHRDTAVRVLPVELREIREMLGELRGAELLRGFRGGAPADVDEVVDVIHRVSRIAEALGDDLEALEINPLLVDGSRIEALDVLIRWRTPPLDVDRNGL